MTEDYSRYHRSGHLALTGRNNVNCEESLRAVCLRADFGFDLGFDTVCSWPTRYFLVASSSAKVRS